MKKEKKILNFKESLRKSLSTAEHGREISAVNDKQEILHNISRR